MLNSNFNILIINNVKNNNSCLLCDSLIELAYNVIQKNNVDDAYKYINDNSIDLVLLNCEKSDEASLNIIKKINEIVKLDIIFLTNDVNPDLRNNFSKYDLLDYKVKLNNIFTVIDEIDNLIQKLLENANTNILLIKKKTDIRDSVESLLKSRSYKVEILSSGASGWKAIDKNKNISMIIIDISLHDVDSHDLILKAKKIYGDNLPILALTNKYDHIQMQDSIANGLSDFIKIPVITEEFNLKIDLWMKNFRQAKLLDEQQKQLQQTLNSFEALTNATIEGLIMFDDNTCVDINDAALELFEYNSKKELVGKNILEIVSNNITSYDKEELLKNNVDHEFEILMCKKDGKDFPAQLKERNIILDSKEIKILAVLDLTEIKKKEKMLAQQSKMAAMGEMIGNIAHQWRQPLSSISIAASSIKINYEIDMVEEDELILSLDGIVDSTEFLSNTINDFQSFLKGDSIKTTYMPKTIIEKLLKLVDGNIKSAGVTVIQEHEENISLYGLGNELTQSLLNIVNNARDALKDKEFRDKFILIKTYLDENKKNVIISVQDNAGGIPKEIINKIFEPYFTTKHQSQGTGLGLYMTHQMIIDHMNGEIVVCNADFEYDAKKYHGALFKVMLPLNK